MKKIITALLITLVFVSTGFAARMSDKTAKLLEARQTDCYVEGVAFGDDMVLGARGAIQFIYLDSKLSEAISSEHSLEPWVDDLNQYYGYHNNKEHVVFIAQLTANKPWQPKEELVTVGNCHLSKDDIVSTSWKSPFGEEIPSNSEWHFAFVVPRSEVKPGREIMIGYGEDLVKWKVPAK